MNTSDIVAFKLQAFRLAVDIVDRSWQSEHTRPTKDAYFKVYEQIIKELELG